MIRCAALIGLVGSLLVAQWKDPAESDLVRPEALVKMLQDRQPPAIFYVGPPVLFRAARIPGAKLAGPAVKPEALATLRSAVAGLKRDAQIVIYCGCCPWDQCPNVRPALKLLRDLGFRNARALYLPTNMRTDWTAKGYPLDRSAGPDSRFSR